MPTRRDLFALTVSGSPVPSAASSAVDAYEEVGHAHGPGGFGDLGDRLLESGVVAAPFLAVVTVMITANRRANRLVRDRARGVQQ